MAKRKLSAYQALERDQNSRRIVVAVDFGTTYSGLAWAQTLKPELQVPVIQWPDATSGGLESITNDKVPTEIQYDGEDYLWGFQIPEYGQRHQWFKLDLDQRQTSQARDASVLSTSYLDPLAAPPRYEKTAETLSIDYLTALRKHAELVIRNKLPASALISTPIEYVITVPAVWSHTAQLRTRKCAEKAGMGQGSTLHIITEPEAAAMYALDIMDPHDIKVGDTFVLCDAGGGTVDLISYKVKALKPTLSIEEATPGSGMLCGSSFLNRIFEKFLKDKLAALPGWDEEILEEAMKRFEMVTKRQFRGGSDEVFMIPVSGLRDHPGLGIRRGRLTVTGDQVKEIFEPVIGEVLDLVLTQIRATKTEANVKAVLLVGGFGQNAYLRDRIRASVGVIEVMQSPNGWTAVVRGALMKGLTSSSPSFATVGISSRRARKCYGIGNMTDEFKSGEDDETLKYWNDFDGKYLIKKMDWFINKGDQVAENKPFGLEYMNTWKVGSAHDEIELEICSFCDPHNMGAPPKYPDDAQIKPLLTVKTDLSAIPRHRLGREKGSDGKMYYVVRYEIEITYYSAFTKYELIYDGVNYGGLTAEYV